VAAHLEAWSIPAAQVDEVDWSEVVRVGPLELVATPARHYSGRHPLWRDETLWSSWVVKGPRHRLFFSGDSGAFDGFKAIGAAHGPFDVTLMKVGASDPLWPDIHLSPAEEAVAAAAARGVAIVVPRPGQLVEPSAPTPLEAWWR